MQTEIATPKTCSSKPRVRLLPCASDRISAQSNPHQHACTTCEQPTECGLGPAEDRKPRIPVSLDNDLVQGCYAEPDQIAHLDPNRYRRPPSGGHPVPQHYPGHPENKSGQSLWIAQQ